MANKAARAMANHWRISALAVMSVLAIAAGAASAWHMQSAQSDHVGVSMESADPFAGEPWPAECHGSTASFSAAMNLEDLARESDAVIRGRALERRTTADSFDAGVEQPVGLDWVISEVEVLDSFRGDVEGGSTIEVGNPLGHCLVEGKEYYLFLMDRLPEGQEYTDTSELQSPVRWGFNTYGPQNVWRVEDGTVLPDQHSDSPVARARGKTTDDVFRQELQSAITAVGEHDGSATD